ncbi:dimethylarginine dimethylaminohydrolase family protein [Lutispora sp.]|uniref:dimethylarginine dimethylaminohydrolase family protein n=1 Tax=Lutispora sp. TaxID=2828727 RepID=UPI0035643EEC
MRFVVDSAHGGYGWIERSRNHRMEIGDLWGKCGVVSETGELKHVLLRRPGREVENIESPSDVLWTAKMDPEKARYQHDELAYIYETLGVEVSYIEDNRANSFPNIIYVRDIFTMTQQGAIISRLASKVRSGEERIIQNELSRMGIPIIATAHDNMYLEGPDILLVNKDLVFIGVGLRTNNQAAKFIYELLKLQGYTDIIIIQTTYGCGHLDGVINILNSKYAAIVPKRASYEIYYNLKRHGFTIVDLNNIDEVDELMSINFVSINEDTIVLNKGAVDTISLYKSCGINCIEVDVSELMKGGGAVHCMTGIIRRECE